MGPDEMQEAVARLGPLVENWLRPVQRNADGICEALCVDWVSKQLPVLSAAIAPSELVESALKALQGRLEDKKALAATRANEKSTELRAASNRRLEEYKAWSAKVAAAFQAQYARLGVTCERVRWGPFESVTHNFSGGPTAQVTAVEALDVKREKYQDDLNEKTAEIQQGTNTASGVIQRWQNLTDAERARKGYKHVFRDMAEPIRTLKAVSCIGAQYASADAFAHALGAQKFEAGTAWLIALDTPDERHAMACYRRTDSEYLLLEPNLGLYRMESNWTAAIPILAGGYTCTQHRHRATLFNRVRT